MQVMKAMLQGMTHTTLAHTAGATHIRTTRLLTQRPTLLGTRIQRATMHTQQQQQTASRLLRPLHQMQANLVQQLLLLPRPQQLRTRQCHSQQ